MARCEQVSFWVAGMKVRSGEATAHLPQGELKVVCRKAKAGEINVQELPDGALLRVPKVGFFAFDSSRWRGRLGRTVDVKAVAERLQGQTRTAYLKRVANSRDDLNSAKAIVTTGGVWYLTSRPTVLAMLRRNPALAGPILDMGCTDPDLSHVVASLLSAISDPVLLHYAMVSTVPEPHMATLAESAAERLAKIGFHRDAGAWVLAKLSSSAERHHIYAYLPIIQSFPDEYLAEFAQSLLSMNSVSPSFVDLLSDAIFKQDPTRTATRAKLLKEVVAAMPPRTWLEEDSQTVPRFLKRCESALVPMMRAEASGSIDWESLSDEDLIATYLQERTEPFFDERHAAMEIAKRPLPTNPTMNDHSVFWARAMRHTGKFSDEEITAQLFNNNMRIKAMGHFTERQLRRAIEVGHTSAPVLLEGLRRLDDVLLWERFVIASQELYLGRWLAEHAPLDTLAELAIRNTGTSPAELAVWEVAAGRNVVDPLVSAKHHSPVVRRITARRAASAEVSNLLLSDRDPSVQSAATRHCRDISVLQQHLDAGVTGTDDRGRSLQDAFIRRIRQLEHFELARATAQTETIVARAALPLIQDRTLLLELIEFPELATFIAPEIERISYKPPQA